jgi:hypothetical protein
MPDFAETQLTGRRNWCRRPFQSVERLAGAQHRNVSRWVPPSSRSSGMLSRGVRSKGTAHADRRSPGGSGVGADPICRGWRPTYGGLLSSCPHLHRSQIRWLSPDHSKIAVPSSRLSIRAAIANRNSLYSAYSAQATKNRCVFYARNLRLHTSIYVRGRALEHTLLDTIHLFSFLMSFPREPLCERSSGDRRTSER